MNRARQSKCLLSSRGAVAVVAAAHVGVLVFAPAAMAAGSDEPGYTVEPIGIPFEPTFTVENFVHPNADQIAAKYNILLKDGDGHIMYTACSHNNPAQIEVDALDRGGEPLCFTLTGDKGWLKMEIPGTYIVTAGSKKLTVVSLPPEGESITNIVPANSPVYIDPGTTGKVTLVQLEVQ